MTHTKRFYNRPNRIRDFFHPYIQFCCGHCRDCKDWMKSKRRRREQKRELREMIKMEQDLIRRHPDHQELQVVLDADEEYLRKMK